MTNQGYPLHPDALAVLELIKLSGRPPYHELAPQVARELYARGRLIMQPEPPDVAQVLNLSAPGPAGPVPLRLYRGLGTGPTNGAHSPPLPTLIYFHGGGWVIGDLETHDVLCRELANRAQCCVIAVDYRLAPEHVFPAAVEDCEAAVRFIVDQAATLHVDASHIAVGGDSAGGNLAAVMAMMARDQRLPPIMFQLLIYPATDMSGDKPSYRRVVDDMPLTAQTMVYFRDLYIPNPGDFSDWRASPLLAPSHQGLAPAYILTVHHDPLCDEGRLYGAALERAGVAVQYLHITDQFHGFITMAKLISACAPTTQTLAQALRAAFAR